MLKSFFAERSRADKKEREAPYAWIKLSMNDIVDIYKMGQRGSWTPEPTRERLINKIHTSLLGKNIVLDNSLIEKRRCYTRNT